MIGLAQRFFHGLEPYYKSLFVIYFVISFIITPIAWLFGQLFPNIFDAVIAFIPGQLLIVLFFTMTLFIIFVLVVRIISYARGMTRTLAILHSVDDISSSYTLLQQQLRWPGADTHLYIDNSIDVDALEIVSYEFLNKALNHISKSLTSYTRDYAHISLKLFSKTDGSIRVIARDSQSARRRQETDEFLAEFSYKDNTAFRSIIDDSRTSYYLSNNLQSECKSGRYENKNENWLELYNSTIVVPIAMPREASHICDDSVTAFICADNKMGRFDMVCKEFLLCQSSYIHDILLILSQISELRSHSAVETSHEC